MFTLLSPSISNSSKGFKCVVYPHSFVSILKGAKVPLKVEGKMNLFCVRDHQFLISMSLSLFWKSLMLMKKGFCAVTSTIHL